MKATGGGIFSPLLGRKGYNIVGIDINNKHLKSKKSAKGIADILEKAIITSVKK